MNKNVSIPFKCNYQPSVDPGINCGSVSKTKQSFKDECDINAIVERFAKTGLLTSQNSKTPLFEDFTSSTSYFDSVLLVQDAENRFANLPSSIRDRFSNDPLKFFQFCENPQNASELVDLGLAIPRGEEASTFVKETRSRSIKQEPDKPSKKAVGVPAAGEGPDTK